MHKIYKTDDDFIINIIRITIIKKVEKNSIINSSQLIKLY